MERRVHELLEALHKLQFSDPDSLLNELRHHVLSPTLKKAEEAFCSSKLLNSEVSLLKFVRVHRTSADRLLWKAMTVCLQLLSEYIKVKAEALRDYVPDIRDLCLQLFASSTKSSMVKDAALKPLIKLLEAFGPASLLAMFNPQELFAVLLDSKLRFEEKTMGSNCNI